MAQPMDLFVAPRAGIWCRSVTGWDDFARAAAGCDEPTTRLTEPVPDLLPARESRRTPLLVRLALEVAVQACRENGVAPAQVMSVFASAMGDIEITDYMCRTLAAAQPMLSPTRFHNSVHNAAAGYWSIGTGNRRASTAVAAHDATFAMALLEAAALAESEGGIVLLDICDVAAPPVLTRVCANRQPFAAALLLSKTPLTPAWRSLQVDCLATRGREDSQESDWLSRLTTENQSAQALRLLAPMTRPASFGLRLPLGSATELLLGCGERAPAAQCRG